MAELNQITYNPNNWVDDSTPDIEADTLNNIEQGIAQATELLNDLVTEYKNLVSKKMIVNNFLSTNPETVLSGPMGKELKEELERLNRDLAGKNISDSFEIINNENVVITAIEYKNILSIKITFVPGRELALNTNVPILRIPEKFKNYNFVCSSDYSAGAIVLFPIVGNTITCRTMISKNVTTSSLISYVVAIK